MPNGGSIAADGGQGVEVQTGAAREENRQEAGRSAETTASEEKSAVRIAVGLILFIAVWVSVGIANSPKSAGMPHSPPAQEAHTDNKTRDEHYPTDDSPLPVRIIQSPSDAAHSHDQEEKGAEHDRQELDASKRSAMAAEKESCTAWYQTFIAGFGLILLTWTLYETRRTAKAAIKATELSERMIEGYERPYIFLGEISGRVFSRDIDAHICAIVEEGRGVPVEDRVPTVILKMFNKGKTPGIFTSFHAAVIAYERIPLMPEYSSCTEQTNHIFIGAGDSSEAVRHIQMDANFGAHSFGSDVIFFGYIAYEDVFGTRYRTGFGWKVSPDFPHNTFHPIGGKAYNYRTQKDS